MKRIISMLFIAAMMCCGFQSCSDDDPVLPEDETSDVGTPGEETPTLPGEGEHDSPVVDFAPVVFQFDVVDKDGASLVNPANAADMEYINKIAVEYNGKTYHPRNLKDVMTEMINNQTSRAYMAHLYGLVYEVYPDMTPSLWFGEFDGAENWTNLTFKIIWPEGTADTVVFNQKVEMGEKLPEITWSMTINGQPQDTREIKHVRD